MIVIKIIQTTIDILNPNDIYSSNIEYFITQELEKRYKNRCYLSILITDINKIIRLSSINMVNNRLDGAAYVDVQFEVSGIVFVRGEILHDCKIIEILSNNITAEHKYAGIKILNGINNNIIKILEVGQIIPVIVQNFRYMPNQRTISITAVPFIPYIDEYIIYYNITSPLNPQETDKLIHLLEQVKKEEDMHIEISKIKSYDFFKDILYPYKVNQKFEQSKKASVLNLKSVSFDIKKLLEIKTGLITYPNEDSRSNKRLFWSDKYSDYKNTSVNNNFNEILNADNVLVIDSNLYSVLVDIINKYLLYLQALRGFVDTYTFDNMNKLVNYWKLCKHYKI